MMVPRGVNETGTFATRNMNPSRSVFMQAKTSNMTTLSRNNRKEFANSNEIIAIAKRKQSETPLKRLTIGKVVNIGTRCFSRVVLAN